MLRRLMRSGDLAFPVPGRRARPAAALPASLIPPERPLPYSWVLTGQLALGPMPAGPAHWQQLEEAGLRSRFSCCYAEEESLLSCPAHWPSARISLPDHRAQEPLTAPRLLEALEAAAALLQEAGPLYLHCRAGIERSPLIAVGLTARVRRLSLFDALDWVRRCHPAALPLADHLELLEQLLGR